MSDTTTLSLKHLDGRTFWGVAFFIYCWCVLSDRLMVEQPPTIIPNFYLHPTQQLRPTDVGDDDVKPIHLFERGRARVDRTATSGLALSGHKRLRDFDSADERDRWRSSWARFPQLCKAVVAAPSISTVSQVSAPRYLDEIEIFAAAWFDAGLPVPADYLAADAQPASADARRYQAVRGKGDGRRPPSVIPVSRRGHSTPSASRHFSGDADPTGITIDLSPDLTTGVALLFVCMQLVPLVWACTDGIRVLGAELTAPASVCYTTATRLARALLPDQTLVTFLAGRSETTGLRAYVTPIAHRPPEALVARSAGARRRLAAAGVRFAWLAITALVGTAVSGVARQAVFACDGMRSEQGHVPFAAMDVTGSGGAYRLGVTGVRSLVDRPDGMLISYSSLEQAAARMFKDVGMLADTFTADTSEWGSDMREWAAQIQAPPLAQIPMDLLDRLSTFGDPRLDDLAFPAIPLPREKPWAPRMPQQPHPPSSFCPRRAADLMPPRVWLKVERWLHKMLADLICVRDLGDACERSRPGVLVIGQADLYPHARGIVWDFRRSPAECATALDYDRPLQHTLNVPYLLTRLKDYPNQELLSFIAEGVRPWADVELQTVLTPHLMSLAKGYPSVIKELKRMSAPELNWYSIHPDFPFWPMYSLAEGCVPRKLENRWRRCEEGGAPRKEVFDSSGVRALSLNEASKVHHVPIHFLQDERPEWLDYLRLRHLPPTPEMETAVANNRGTKWLRQRMPTLSQAMRAMLVLRRAAHVMGEPVYLFGDDIKDYFNHMNHANEVAHHMNTIFLDADDLDDEPTYTANGDSLVFVHEKRMGFGLHPWSIVAQELSEATNHMLREDIDAVEDPLLEADTRPSVQQWLESRRRLEARVGGHQRRLYFVLMYCDDNIIGVVGVHRAMRVLKAWRRLTTNMGFIMAIAEKRSVGVWCLWIGALVFSTLGLFVIPKEKLVRAATVIRRLLQAGVEFSEYRSLMGLLEHLRCIARIPKRYTHGLYAPHGATGEGQDGPNALVRPRVFMVVQFQKWLDLLGHCGGCAITDGLRRGDISSQPSSTFFAGSDAATDSQPPGMGGFMHGLYWQLPISDEHLKLLHITVLELLAAGFSCMTFSRLVPPHARLLLMVDATAAFYTLADESERSDALIEAHHALLDDERFQQAASRSDLVHGSGDAQFAADAVSRSKWDEITVFARQLRLHLQRVEPPSECRRIYDLVVDKAQQANRVVRHGHRPSSPPAIPPPAVRLIDFARAGASNRDPFAAPSSSSFLAQEVIEHMVSKIVELLRVQRQHDARRSTEKLPHSTNRGVAAATDLPRTPASPALQRMPTANVDGVTLAAPAFKRTTARSDRRERREAAARESARRRAVHVASPSATPSQLARITAGLHHSARLAQLGAAHRTLDKDDLAWERWEEYSQIYGFDPVVERDVAVHSPDVLSSRLGLFLLWVYPKVRGRGRDDAHPRSVLNNYPGAVARVLKRDHKLPIPRAATYEAEAKGLLRGYKRIYGTLALAPHRRQPMTRSKWSRVEQLTHGQPLPGRSSWLTTNSHVDKQGIRLGRVLSETAHRLGEVVSYTDDEISYLTRENVTYQLGGRMYVDPTEQQLRAMQVGDIVFLSPCSSKPDQFGEDHCTFPSVLQYDGTERSAAGAIRAIELARPVHGHHRKRAPLFADVNGNPFTYYELNRWLNDLMTALFGSAVASTLSWHSFRIELACLLRAAQCPDSVIQLICRWKCPESVQTYAQIGTTQHVSWLQLARATNHDAVRTNNMVALDNADAYAELANAAGTPAAGRAAPRAQPATRGYPTLRQRVRVLWGDEWYEGVCTSRRQGVGVTGQPATLHRILYDAAGAYHAHGAWHDMAVEEWQPVDT